MCKQYMIICDKYYKITLYKYKITKKALPALKSCSSRSQNFYFLTIGPGPEVTVFGNFLYLSLYLSISVIHIFA